MHAVNHIIAPNPLEVNMVINKLQTIYNEMRSKPTYLKYLHIYFDSMSNLVHNSLLPTATQFALISSMMYMKTSPVYATASLIGSVVSAYIVRRSPKELYHMYSKLNTVPKVSLACSTVFIHICASAMLAPFASWPINYIGPPIIDFAYLSFTITLCHIVNTLFKSKINIRE